MDKQTPESQQYYTTLIDRMAQGVFTQLADGTLVDVNPAALEMFGLERDQFFGRTSFSPGWKVVNEDGTDLLPEQHPSMVALRTGLPVSDAVVGVYNPSKKSFVWLIVNAIPIIREGEDTPYQVFVTLHDTTRRMKEQEELRQSKAKLQNILDNSTEWIWEIDLCGKHIYSNHQLSNLLGYHPEEFVGRNYLDFLHEDDSQAVKKALPKLITEKRGWHGWILRWRHKDGSFRYLESNAKPILNSAGEISGYSGADRDITDRKKAEADNQKREKLFRDFFESNPVPTIITSFSGLVHMINPAFSQSSGFSAEEVIGKTSQELGFWRDLADRERMVAAIRADGLINNLEASFYTKNNQQLTCLVSSRAIEYEGEQRILSTLLDVTEQRKAEKALHKLDQAKSDFIKIAAHELQTPLVAIFGYAELLEDPERLTGADQQKQYAKVILENAEILSRLVNDLLDIEKVGLGHSLSIVKRKASYAKLIKRVVASLTPKYPEHRFMLTHENSLPETFCIDEDRIAQVLQNLLVNALKYSSGGERVEVSTSTAGNSVTTSIRDYGLGMTTEEVERVFEIFYRANPENPLVGGLGLGMTIVKKIVEEHGGDISISSNPGQGTTVSFTLPIIDNC